MKILAVNLNNGVVMPAVGLGTFDSNHPEVIAKALECGYAAIDTAEYYKRYEVVGEALKQFEENRASVVDAPLTKNLKNPNPNVFQIIDEADFHKNIKSIPHGPSPDGHTIFLTSKVWPPLSAKKVRETAERFYSGCLRQQGDLFLLHWPGVSPDLVQDTETDESVLETSPTNVERRFEAWREMEKLYHEKRFRAIGVSNFMYQHLKPLLDDIDRRKKEGDKLATYPAMNQIEISPWLMPPKDLSQLCTQYNIHFTAYSPIGAAGRVKDCLSNPVVVELGKKHNVNPACIILRFLLQSGYIVVPKSSDPKRVIENFDVFNYELDQDDLKKMATLNDGTRSCTDPNTIE